MDKGIEIKAVRLIPFDLGASLNKKEMTSIENFLKERYEPINLTNIQKAILSKNPISYRVHSDKASELLLKVFDTGIGVFVIKEAGKRYADNLNFVFEYLKERKQIHEAILKWKHPLSATIESIIDHLRRLMKGKKGLRPSASNSWENGGLSYVMTIPFLSYSALEKKAITWSDIPDHIQKGIQAILNPSLLFLEDSLMVDHNERLGQEYITEFLDGDLDQPFDYEQRKHIMTFMSWAAVLIVGNFNEIDEDEYIYLEIELQHYWCYIYCLDNALPIKEMSLEKTKIKIEDVISKKLETELIEENLKFIEDSSIPERFKPVLEGIIKTSGIQDLLTRYIKKLDFCREILMIRQQSKQRLFGQTSEILLFLVAYLQLTPLLYKFLMKNHEVLLLMERLKLNQTVQSYIVNIVLIVIFLIGSSVLAFKNKYVNR